MAYDRRYSDDEIGGIIRKGRRQGMILALVLYLFLMYWDDLLMLLP